MKEYGYLFDSSNKMLPLNQKKALELTPQAEVYLLYKDNTESLAYDEIEIRQHYKKGGICGIEHYSWQQTKEQGFSQAQTFFAELKGNCEYRQYSKNEITLIEQLQAQCRYLVLLQQDNGFKVAIHNNSLAKADELQAAQQAQKTPTQHKKR